MSQPVPTPAYDALSLAHQRFVDRLLMGDSKTDAYLAGHDVTRESAATLGVRLFGKVEIADALAERKAQLAERTAVTPERLVEELASIAFARMSTFVSWGPGGSVMVDDTMLSPADMAAVADVSEQPGKPGETPKLRIKLHPKQPALDRLIELFDVTPETIRKLYPQMDLASPEAVAGVVSILKKAQERQRAEAAALEASKQPMPTKRRRVEGELP